MKNCLLILALFGNLIVVAEIEPFSAVSPDGTYVALIKNKQVNVYKTSDGSLVFKHKANDMLVGVGFSNDESKITISDDWYTFQTYDLGDENSLLWESALKDVVDLYEVSQALEIRYAANDEYILQLNDTEAVFLDAYSGEFVGYEEIDNKVSWDKYWYRLQSVQTNKDNSFSIGYYGKEEHSTVKLFVEGYGNTSHQTVYNTSVLGGFNESQVVTYDKGSKGFEMKINSKSFQSLKNTILGDLPDITFSQDGSQFVGQNQFGLEFYSATSAKKIWSDKTGKRFKVVYLDANQLVIVDAETFTFKILNPNSGQQLADYNKADDFLYRGTAIAKSKFTKEATTIFYDDFNDNENDWSVEPDEISDGKMILAADGEGTYRTWNSKIEIDQFRDFEIETAIKQPADVEEEVSIFWGRNADVSRYQAFYLKGNKYGVWEYLGFWKKHKGYEEIVNAPADGYNKIRIRKENDSYSFYLNGELVHTMPYKGFHGSKVGFSYPAEYETMVDYLKISYINEKAYSSAPIFVDEFDNNDNKWASGKKEGRYDQTLQDGYFSYQNLHTNTYSKWNDRLFLDPDQDWELETSMKIAVGDATYATALVWGRDDESSKRYRFGFTKNSKFVIDSYDGSDWTNHKDWAFENLLSSRGYNKLKIRKQGKKYKFYINEKLVEILDDGPYSFGPRVGFDISKETTAHFDYIRARYINPRKERRDPCNYYIPYVHPNADGNKSGRLLIAGVMKCNKPPGVFKSHSKNLTWRQNNVFYNWVTYYDKEEADLGWQKLIDQYDYAGYAVWSTGPLQCFEGCN